MLIIDRLYGDCWGYKGYSRIRGIGIYRFIDCQTPKNPFFATNHQSLNKYLSNESLGMRNFNPNHANFFLTTQITIAPAVTGFSFSR
jgi:hypothetical protein